MEKHIYTITFMNASGEAASRYANELRNALLDATTDVEVDRRRANNRTQDFGTTLVVVLGTGSTAAAIVKAISDWLKMRHSAIIDIEKEGHHVRVENITSKDASRLAELTELFQSKEQKKLL